MSAATGTNIVGVPDVLRTITKSEYLSWVRRPVRTKKVTLMANEESSENSESLIPQRYVFTQSDQPVLIKSRTVLPARRENFEVTTADGKRLVGELALPEGEIKATLVTFHPLPTHGGYIGFACVQEGFIPSASAGKILRFCGLTPAALLRSAVQARECSTEDLPRKKILTRSYNMP